MFNPIEILGDYSGGVNTEDLPENLAANQSANILNMDFDGISLRKAKGFSLFGTDEDTGVGYKLYKHWILPQTEVLIKVVGTKIKFYDTVSGEWQLLYSGSVTEGNDWFFDSFNGYLYGSDGEVFLRWKGSSFSTLDGDIAIGAATIDLASGDGDRFASSGSGMINGDTFTWSGKTADQLTGVSGIASAHSDGDRIIADADTASYSGNPKGTIGGLFENRLFIVDASSPATVYYSKLADATTPYDDLANFAIAGAGAGDAGYDIFPAPILGMDTFFTGGNDPVLLLFCADGSIYTLSVSDSGGATVSTHPKFRDSIGDLKAQDLTARTENDMLFVDNFNYLRVFGYGDSSTVLKSDRLSDIISPTMEDLDFSRGSAFFHNRKAYLSGRNNLSPKNNFVVVKDTSPSAFGFYDHWFFNDFEEYNNNLYGLSSFDGKVYKLNDGYNADGGVIYSLYKSRGMNFGAPLIYKLLSSIRISGYISKSCSIIYKIYFDDGITPEFEFVVSGDNTNITNAAGSVAYGTVVFGAQAFNGDLPKGEVYQKFIAELTMPTFKDFFVMRVEVENNQKDVDYKLDKTMFYAERQDSGLMLPAKLLSSQ